VWLYLRFTLSYRDVEDRHCRVWTAPADQGLFFDGAPVVGAVMSSAFDAETKVRWP